MLRLSIAAGLISLALVSPAAAQPPGSTAPDTPPGAVMTAPGTGVPFSLDEALRAAVKASETIDAAKAEVDRSRTFVTSARAGYLPSVNGTASYQRTLATEFDDINFGPPTMMGDEEIDLPFGRRNNWRLGVTASQPLFDGFRTSAAIDQAKSGVRQAELGVTTTKTELVLQVATAYYDAVLADRQLEIADVTLQQAEQTLKETQLKFDQGTAPEFDLVRAQVSRDNQSTQLIQFRVQRDVAYVQLRRLIGVPLDQPLQLTSRLDADDMDPMLETARKAVDLPPNTTRVAIAQAKEQVVANKASVDVANSAWWPTLSAGTDFGLVNYENQPVNTDWRTNWTVGLNLSIPIFDGFRRKANVDASKAALKSSQAQLQNATEIAQIEAAQAAANVQASATTLETTTRTVGQAKRAYQIAELRFSQGASTHLELVDARVQLEQSQVNQARSQHSLRLARIRQELLVGLRLGGTLPAAATSAATTQSAPISGQSTVQAVGF